MIKDDQLSDVIGTLHKLTTAIFSDAIQRKLILDNLTEAVFTVDIDFKITSVNKAAQSITGVLEKDVLGKKCTEIFSSPTEEKFCVIDQVLAEKRPVTKVTRHLQVGDRLIPVMVNAAPLTDNSGVMVGGVQSFQEIQEIFQRQLVFDSAFDGVLTVDMNFNITLFNKAAEQLTGFKQDEVLGKPFTDILSSHADGPDLPKTTPLVTAIQTGQPVIEECIYINTAAGDILPVSVRAAPLIDARGVIIGGVETIRDLTEITELRRKLSPEGAEQGILTRSPKMRRILSVLPEFAKSDATILILGESGTGKELIAQSIHAQSNRSDNPFVAVNSGALPDTLLESELFGYKAGAFTDARKDKKGRFAAAEKGTLFLDEIGDISPAMQVKLLRVIQSKTYEPLGSNTPIKTDIRIIAATNKNLEKMVNQGTFREDLYYRLNVVKIDLPPLRERIEDVPLLVEYFIGRFNEQRDRHVKGISEEVLSLLMHLEYPGNIRELENIIEYAFILCHEGLILPRHLPEWLVGRHEGDKSISGPLTLREMERKAIMEALRRNDDQKMKTCRELGISKDTLRRKLAAYGISDS